MKILFLIALVVGALVLMQSCRVGVDVLKKFDTTFAQKMELREVASAVNREYTATLQMPVSNFESFCRSNLRAGASKRDTGRDFWGTPFRLGVATGRIVVSSAGPDHKWDTPDDIRYSLNCDYKGPTEASCPGPWKPTAAIVEQEEQPRRAPRRRAASDRKRRSGGFGEWFKLR